MIRPIVHVEALLARPSVEATPGDEQLARDLADTLLAHRDDCLGLAANMIGSPKRAIAVMSQGAPLVMMNPRITGKRSPYQTEEGCLSLAGTRPTQRWRTIEVAWQDERWEERHGRFSGIVAQAIQHEVDHCEGILI